MLAAAIGGAGAALIATLARPLGVQAAPTAVMTETANTATALTSLTNTTLDGSAFQADVVGTGTAIKGTGSVGVGVAGAATTGAGVLGTSASGGGVVGTTQTTDHAGVAGTAGDTTDSSLAADIDLDTGIYGYADQTFVSSGVWGESIDGVGVAATGALGMLALGFDGTYSEASGGTGVHAHAGGGVVPTPPTNSALFASVGTTSQIGLEARGRVRFPNRSGRVTIGAGKASVAVSVSGMTSSNIVFAVLNSSGSSRWVRTVIPATGKITIYLNAAVSSSSSIAWLVLG
jgi:hypothetical protein